MEERPPRTKLPHPSLDNYFPRKRWPVLFPAKTMVPELLPANTMVPELFPAKTLVPELLPAKTMAGASGRKERDPACGATAVTSTVTKSRSVQRFVAKGGR